MSCEVSVTGGQCPSLSGCGAIIALQAIEVMLWLDDSQLKAIHFQEACDGELWPPLRNAI